MFVKICGITTEEDALLAVALGADAVGFLFAPSPRQISPTRAGDIAKRLPPEILTVGVFRDELPDRVVSICQTSHLRAAQLHGAESPEAAAAVRQSVNWVIKAFAAGSRLFDRAGEYSVDAVLVDAPSPGSGHVFDWSLVDSAPTGQRLILAGGLKPDNVGQAIELVRPWGVDVSTGVESSPGRKDARLVKAFIDAARAHAPVAHRGPDTGPYDWQDDG
jgi:phosphoribosylanthranilate isomerase